MLIMIRAGLGTSLAADSLTSVEAKRMTVKRLRRETIGTVFSETIGSVSRRKCNFLRRRKSYAAPPLCHRTEGNVKKSALKHDQEWQGKILAVGQGKPDEIAEIDPER